MGYGEVRLLVAVVIIATGATLMLITSSAQRSSRAREQEADASPRRVGRSGLVVYCGCVSAFTAAAALAAVFLRASALALLGLSCLPLLGHLVGLRAARKRSATAGPSSRDDADPGRAARSLKSRERREWPVGLPMRAGPFLILAMSAVLLYLLRDALPDSYPIHFDARGRPNLWLRPDTLGPYIWLSFAAFAQGVLALSAWGVQTRASVAPSRAFHWVLLATEYLIAIAFSLVAFHPLLSGQIGRWSILLLVLVVPIVVLGIALRGSQQGGAAARESRAVPLTRAARGDEGLIYNDPEDPALFVARATGYTLNFGHPAAKWVLWGGLLTVAVGLSAFVLAMQVTGGQVDTTRVGADAGQSELKANGGER